MNLFEALRNDHDIQRNLLKELVETEGDTETRKRLFYDIKHELEIHEDAEEQFFYTALFNDELTQKEARHGVAEHHEIDEILEELNNKDFSSPSWLPLAKDLKHKVLHHLEDEEKSFFQLAGKVLSDKDKTTLAKKYIDKVKSERAISL